MYRNYLLRYSPIQQVTYKKTIVHSVSAKGRRKRSEGGGGKTRRGSGRRKEQGVGLRGLTGREIGKGIRVGVRRGRRKGA